MKALTVWQPWASLIAIGAKPYEFRGWPAPASLRGQRIAIHAGARPVRRGEVQGLLLRLDDPREAWTTCLKPELAVPLLDRVLASPGVLPLSSIVCTVVLGVPVNGYDVVGEFGGVVNDSDRDQHANWAWPVAQIEQLQPPVEAKGAQGFWNWEGVLPGPEASYGHDLRAAASRLFSGSER